MLYPQSIKEYSVKVFGVKSLYLTVVGLAHEYTKSNTIRVVVKFFKTIIDLVQLIFQFNSMIPNY